MVLWDTIISKLVGTLPETVVGYYTKKKELEQEVTLEKLRGKAEYERAKTARASESEGRDADWELESIRNSGWKDEWVLILLSIPLILVFFPYPWGAPAVLEGFAVLETTPDWYRWLVMMIYAAVFGIRVWRRKT